MKAAILRVVWIMVVFALISGGRCYCADTSMFTPWMDDQAFHDWRAANLEHQPFYLTAIEGRLQGINKEWRVKTDPKPQHVGFTWKWFSQLDEDAYQDFCNRIIDQEGYQQIWTQSFTDTSGKQCHQVIFIHSNLTK